MSLGERNAKAKHERGIAREAVVSSNYWLFQPGERVMTCDGFPGVVASVDDGPVAGYEEYHVTLDNGMGGGRYSPSQLSTLRQQTASTEHTAADDYPELGSILSDRPDPATELVTLGSVAEDRGGRFNCDNCGYSQGATFKPVSECPICKTPGKKTALGPGMGAGPTAFDGTHIWVTTPGTAMIRQMDPTTGMVIRTIAVGSPAVAVTFDGAHIWVTGSDGSITELNPFDGTMVRRLGSVSPNACEMCGGDHDSLHHYHAEEDNGEGYHDDSDIDYFNEDDDERPSTIEWGNHPNGGTGYNVRYNGHNLAHVRGEQGHDTPAHDEAHVQLQAKHDNDGYYPNIHCTDCDDHQGALDRYNERARHEDIADDLGEHIDQMLPHGSELLSDNKVGPTKYSALDTEHFSNYSRGINSVHDADDENFARITDGGMHHAHCDESHRARYPGSGSGGISFAELRQKVPHGTTCDECMDEITGPRPHSARECELGKDCEHFDPQEHASFYADPHEALEGMRNEGVDVDHKPAVPHLSDDDPLHDHFGSDDDLHAEQADQNEWEHTYHQRKEDEGSAGHQIDEHFAGPDHQNALHMLDTNPQGPSHYSMLVEAATDPDFRFHVVATWTDVRNKATRLRKDGCVKVLAVDSNGIAAEVKGDHYVYETQLTYAPGTKKVAIWSCGCKWGAYSWGRSGRWKRFEGRMCSHALATSYEALSRGMFGKDVTPDAQRPSWQRAHSPVVVEFDKGQDKNLTRRAVPPGNMKRTFSALTSDDIPSEYGMRMFHKPAEVHPEHSSDAGEVHILDADRSANGKHQVMVIDAGGNSQWPIRYDNGDLGWDNPHAIVTPHHIVHQALDHAQEMDYHKGVTNEVPSSQRGDLDELSHEMDQHLHDRGMDQVHDWLKDNPQGPSHLSALHTLIREAISQGDDPAEVVLALTAAGIDNPQMHFHSALRHEAGQMMDEEDPGGGNGAGDESGEDEAEQMGDGTGTGLGGLGNAAASLNDEFMFDPPLTRESAFLAPLLEALPELAGAGGAAAGAEEAGEGASLLDKAKQVGNTVKRLHPHDQHAAAPAPAPDADTGQVTIDPNYQMHFSTWTPVPDGALPSTDGGEDELDLEGDQQEANTDPAAMNVTPAGSGGSAVASLGGGWQAEVAAAARQHLATTAMKTFTPAEQAAIINEGEGIHAANLDRLEITGTHYEVLDAALGAQDDDLIE